MYFPLFRVAYRDSGKCSNEIGTTMAMQVHSALGYSRMISRGEWSERCQRWESGVWSPVGAAVASFGNFMDPLWGCWDFIFSFTAYCFSQSKINVPPVRLDGKIAIFFLTKKRIYFDDLRFRKKILKLELNFKKLKLSYILCMFNSMSYQRRIRKSPDKINNFDEKKGK